MDNKKTKDIPIESNTEKEEKENLTSSLCGDLDSIALCFWGKYLNEKIDDEELPFYFFWKWEYLRRNAEYIKKEKNNPLLYPRPSAGFSSDEILESLAEGTFQRKGPFNLKWQTDGEKRSFIPYSWDKKEPGNITINCDPSSNEDVLIENIRKIIREARQEQVKIRKLSEIRYEGRHVSEYWDHVFHISETDDISESEAESRIAKKFPNWRVEFFEFAINPVTIDMNLSVPYSPGKRQPKDNDAQRAIGLWLWDYVKNTGCSSGEAINEFGMLYGEKEFSVKGGDPLKVETISEDRYYRLRKITDNCIKSAEVLPLKNR